MRGSLAFGGGWPGSSTRLSIARVVYFGTVLVAGIAVPGIVLGVAGAPLAALALALCVGAVGAAAFAPLVGLVGR
jgi:hypothetical protein